jgi:serine phosphatase RsbU (regulator of sigma subunit)
MRLSLPARIFVAAAVPLAATTAALAFTATRTLLIPAAGGLSIRLWIAAGTFAAVGGVATLLGLAWALRPLRHLARAVRPEGSDRRSGDDLSVVADAIYSARTRIGHLAQRTRTAEDLEREMELARAIQHAMLPATGLIDHGPLALAGTCIPASRCGGDWWAYRKLQNGNILVVLGDVTGHGVHSALIAGAARGAVEALAAIDEALLVPEYVLSAIHSAVVNVGEHDLRMACFAATIDPTSGIVTYANAGQTFPYILRVNGDGRHQARRLVARSAPLGERDRGPAIAIGAIRLAPGETLVCLTDGLFSCATPDGRPLNERRFGQSLEALQIAGRNDVATARDRLLAGARVARELEDDLTVILCHYRPPVADFDLGASPTKLLWNQRRAG